MGVLGNFFFMEEVLIIYRTIYNNTRSKLTKCNPEKNLYDLILVDFI